MAEENVIICIGCPLACHVTLTVENGAITGIADYQCKIGKEYAENEFTSPCRVVTATVKTQNSVRPLLPVRTDKPVPKDKILECMAVLATVRVEPKLTSGDVIVPDILGTGCNVKCTDNLFL